MLLIFNREEELKAVLEQNDKGACPYYNANIKHVLNGEQILSFRAPLNNDQAKEIEELGYVAVKDKNKNWRLFIVTELLEVHGETLEIEVTAENAFVELDGIIIENEHIDRKTPANALPVLLEGTRWEAGDITGAEIHDLTVKYKSVLYALQQFRDRWNGELIFRIEVAGNRISRRIVDFETNKGQWFGKRLEYGKDIEEIIRLVDAKNVKTALYAFGKTEPTEAGAEPLDIDFANVVWSVANGDPTDKPLGQTWVGDEEAREKYGKKLDGGTEKKHIFGVVDVEGETPEELLTNTWARLQELKTPLVTYKAKVIDLYKLLGIESEYMSLGNLLAIIDRDLNLLLQARAIELIEDLDYEEESEITLGNYLPTFTGDVMQETLNKISSDVATLQDNESNYIRKGDAIDPAWLDVEFEFAKDAIRAGNGTVIFNQGDGILIVDDPDNPQKAIKLQAGQLALANSRNLTTGEFNWRNFGTGEGWLADLVETGHLRFNRSQGGTLTLGGEKVGENEHGEPLYENGVLIVRNDKGENIAELNGFYGGFGTLRIDEITNTQNIVFSTFAKTPNIDNTGDSILFYVDPYDGNDTNSGTSDYPLLRVQEAIDRLPKYLNHNVVIYFSFGLLADDEIIIEGFVGTGQIYIQKWVLECRYVRDFAKGSTVNAGSHFVEIQGRTDTDAFMYGNTANYPENAISGRDDGGRTNIGYVSNNDLTSNQYFSADSSLPADWVDVYMRGSYSNAKYITVWHYYPDARRYYKTKTQVSPDRSRYFTIFDSAREGEYNETYEGHKMYVHKCYLRGRILVKQCQVSVRIKDLFVNAQGTGEPALGVLSSQHVDFEEICTFGDTATQNYNSYVRESNVYFLRCEINNAKLAGIVANAGGNIQVTNCTGGGLTYGMYVMGSGRISGGGTSPQATTQLAWAGGGEYGQKASWVATYGEFSEIPPTPEPTIVEKVQTWSNIDSDTWAEQYSVWDNTTNDVLQGKYNTYGPYRGLWFFGTGIRNTVNGKTIKKIRVYVTRANSSGLSSAVLIRLMPHGYPNKLSGAPSLFTGNVKGVSLSRGVSAWVDCTSEFKTLFANGSAYGIGIYTSSTSNADYARMTTSAKVEITYEVEA